MAGILSFSFHSFNRYPVTSPSPRIFSPLLPPLCYQQVKHTPKRWVPLQPLLAWQETPHCCPKTTDVSEICQRCHPHDTTQKRRGRRYSPKRMHSDQGKWEKGRKPGTQIPLPSPPPPTLRQSFCTQPIWRRWQRQAETPAEPPAASVPSQHSA